MKLSFYFHTLMDRRLSQKLRENIIWNELAYGIFFLLTGTLKKLIKNRFSRTIIFSTFTNGQNVKPDIP